MVDESKQNAKAAFLAELARTYSIRHAAQAAEIHRATAYRWRHEDADFARDWDAALDGCKDQLEQSLYQRAVEGVEEPVFYKGKQCGSVRRYSDTAAIFLLKGARPEKYRENARVEMSGPDGAPIETNAKAQVEVTGDAARTAGILALLQRVGAVPAATDKVPLSSEPDADERPEAACR